MAYDWYFVMVSHFVAHSVHFLHVGEYHLGIDSAVLNHGFHVIGGQEVGNSSITPERKMKEITSKNSAIHHTEKSSLR